MNRKDRRAKAKKQRLRVLPGGKKGPDVPIARRAPTTTPSGRFFNALDQFVRRELEKNADLTLEVAVSGLMQFTANVACAAASKADAEVTAAEYGETCAGLYEQEEKARRPMPPPEAV